MIKNKTFSYSREQAIEAANNMEIYYKDSYQGKHKFCRFMDVAIVYDTFDELVGYILQILNKDHKLNFLIEYHLA